MTGIYVVQTYIYRGTGQVDIGGVVESATCCAHIGRVTVYMYRCYAGAVSVVYTVCRWQFGWIWLAPLIMFWLG